MTSKVYKDVDFETTQWIAEESKAHKEAMDYIYDRPEIAHDLVHERPVTGDTELDEDEVRCYECDEKINLYDDEVYPDQALPMVTVYRCKECANG